MDYRLEQDVRTDESSLFWNGLWLYIQKGIGYITIFHGCFGFRVSDELMVNIPTVYTRIFGGKFSLIASEINMVLFYRVIHYRKDYLKYWVKLYCTLGEIYINDDHDLQCSKCFSKWQEWPPLWNIKKTLSWSFEGISVFSTIRCGPFPRRFSFLKTRNKTFKINCNSMYWSQAVRIWQNKKSTHSRVCFGFCHNLGYAYETHKLFYKFLRLQTVCLASS